MNHKLMLAIAGVAVILIAAGGIGYAFTYTGTTSSTDNNVDSSDMSVQVLKNGQPLTGPMSATQTGGDTLTIGNDYTLKVTGWADDTTLNVAAWIEMTDPSVWVLVQSVIINVNGIGHSCGISGLQTGIPAEFTLEADAGDAGSVYNLSVTLVLNKDIGDMTDEEYALLDTTFYLRFAVGEGNVII